MLGVTPSLEDILKFGVENGASDIHIKVDLKPVFRKFGRLFTHRAFSSITDDQFRDFLERHLDQESQDKLHLDRDLDFAMGLEGVGRFRMNVYHQRGSLAMAVRAISSEVPPLASLHLPQVLERIADYRRGLVLVTGTTGSGKSTTLASMIEHINLSRSAVVITVEDPIEYLLVDKKSIISQREIGIDATSFARATRAAMREDPDVILIGEMRDVETIEAALTAAETGHMVFSTLHTLDASETINRIVTAFPPHQHKQVRTQLGSVLQAVVSQRLIPRKDGKGLAPAAEILLATELVKELVIDDSRTKEIIDAMNKSETYGMQTFDTSIMKLYKAGIITYDEALSQCTNPADFKLKVTGING